MPGEIKLEGGDYQWAPSTYVPPSGGGGLPPGWGMAPHEEAGVPVEQVWRPEPPPVSAPEPPPRMTAREFLATQPTFNPSQAYKEAAQSVTPNERVNLSDKRAAFMGYEFPLSDDSVESIKMILAMEVCLVLERERERVLDAVQHEVVPVPAPAAGQNMPAMSSPQVAVEPQQASDAGAVQ